MFKMLTSVEYDVICVSGVDFVVVICAVCVWDVDFVGMICVVRVKFVSGC